MKQPLSRFKIIFLLPQPNGPLDTVQRRLRHAIDALAGGGSVDSSDKVSSKARLFVPRMCWFFIAVVVVDFVVAIVKVCIAMTTDAVVASEIHTIGR